MSTISAMNLGVQGINKGMDGLRQNAQHIASANIPEQASSLNDIAGPLVDMKLNKLEVEMSAKVVQTASDMIGTLLDIKA
jgi:hypothetical protein